MLCSPIKKDPLNTTHHEAATIRPLSIPLESEKKGKKRKSGKFPVLEDDDDR